MNFHLCSWTSKTPLLDVVTTELKSREFISYTGCSLSVAYINSKTNYEDSVILSEEVNGLGLFEHFSYLNHPVPTHVRTLKPGTRLGRKHP
jgi:hypothetical protein